jgi:hypothetical protein
VIFRVVLAVAPLLVTAGLRWLVVRDKRRVAEEWQRFYAAATAPEEVGR